MDMMSMTAVELGKKIKAGEISVMEATKACIENIKTYDKEYNCFITVDEEGAFKQAEEIQKKIDSGELTGPLAGVPIAIKDNMCQNGVLTTCASKILSNFVPTYTSDAVVKFFVSAIILKYSSCCKFIIISSLLKTNNFWLYIYEYFQLDTIRQMVL